jgi:hypothetical protein
MHAHSIRITCFALILAVIGTAASAQSDRPTTPVRPLAVTKTSIEFEIMMAPEADILAPQEWGPVFEKSGCAVRFREQLLDDQPEITEKVRGSLRMVNVIGELSRDGKLIFPGKSFSLDQGAKLAAWIKELETYGAQGSPDGQPVWGLTDQQFEDLYAELSKPVVAAVEGLEFQSAVKEMGLPNGYAFRLHESAIEQMKAPGADHPLRHEVSGLSRGTALAIVLADYSLGFRPLRTPGGSIELVAEPLDAVVNPWPIGWPIEKDRPRNESAPGLFEQVEAGFEDVSLADVLSAVEQACGTRVIVDYHKCAKREIDPASLKVSLPKKKTAWILILRTVTAQARLTREVMADEAGTAFVYVFPFQPKKPGDAKQR